MNQRGVNANSLTHEYMYVTVANKILTKGKQQCDYVLSVHQDLIEFIPYIQECFPQRLLVMNRAAINVRFRVSL